MTDAVAALHRRLVAAGVLVSDEPSRLEAASRDYAWLSPVLAAQLQGRRAELVAAPRSGEELAFCVAEAAGRGVPLTPRGRGTGNYGQAVPLQGGLVVDLTGMDRILELAPGAARVEPGVTCQALERAARTDGQELALFPSTTKSTLGGFVAGGAGGSGSIEHGFVWDGFVLGAEVLGATVPLRRRSIPANGGTLEAVRPFVHAYGTTGILAELTVRLVPARPWTGLAASFDRFEAALEAAQAVLGLGPARLLGVSEAAIVATFPRRAFLDPASASLRAVVDERILPNAAASCERRGGTVRGSGPALVPAITMLSFNHVTLRAKRTDPSLYHLQLGGLGGPGALAAASAAAPGARLHVDAMRDGDGPGLGGLLLAPYAGENARAATMRSLEAAGVRVVDPHSWLVPDPAGVLADAAACLDPNDLLNPGKLRRLPAEAR